MGQGSEYTFLQMCNKHIERCLISLVLKEMQIKTAVKYTSHVQENG